MGRPGTPTAINFGESGVTHLYLVMLIANS